MRRTLWALFLLLFATFASAQSLGDIARKEKKRREKNQQLGVTARLVTEDEVGSGRVRPSSRDPEASPTETWMSDPPLQLCHRESRPPTFRFLTAPVVRTR